MAEGGMLQPPSTSTVTEEVTPQRSPGVKLKLQKPKNDKKLKWAEGTVDNEHMNKKKSKCCCIYEKPKVFGESSSEDSDNDDCTDHCRGHKKKCFQHHPPNDSHSHDSHSHDSQGAGPSHSADS